MRRKVIVAPLDWGLGHASRCVPVIRALLSQDYEVHIGGAGDSLQFLRKEFPHLPWFDLPAYAPEYPRNGRGMVFKMVMQIPHFIRTIRAERKLTEKYVESKGIDIVISDNRYGCRADAAYSVFITHQSNILMPKRFGWLAPLVRRLNQRLVKQFDICWVPDEPGEKGIAGDLVAFGEQRYHPNMVYVGHLSRLERKGQGETLYDVLAICSGPEPQRTMLEELLFGQLESSGLRFLLIRGVIEDKDLPGRVNYMTSGELNDVLFKSRMVICRSGYSTLMDLSATGKNAILIPTPGQTEQEYLAKRLLKKGICFSMTQEEFDLKTAMTECLKYSGFREAKPNVRLAEAISLMAK